MISVKFRDPEEILDSAVKCANMGVESLLCAAQQGPNQDRQFRDARTALTKARDDLVALLGETPWVLDQVGNLDQATTFASDGLEVVQLARDEIDNEEYETKLREAHRLLSHCISVMDHLEYDIALAGHA